MLELWIARDLDGTLYIFKRKPVRDRVAFFPEDSHDDHYFYLDDNTLFPEVTFENSPQKIKIELV